MSECTKCGKEYYSVNYKVKLCPECHEDAVRKNIEHIKKAWAEKHSKD